MGSIGANANTQCPPGCRTWGWLAFSWARGNEAHRKAWMPVVNHPETHLSWPGLQILFTRKRWREDESWYSCHKMFLPIGEILMCQAWKSHCYELGTCSPCAVNFLPCTREHQRKSRSLDTATSLAQWSDQCLVLSITSRYKSSTQKNVLLEKNANCDFKPRGCETDINQHLKPFADTRCSQLSSRGPGVNLPEADSSNVCIVRIPLHSQS